MSEYVARVTLEVNGQQIDDFDSVEEKEYDLRKAVPLMNKTGFCNVTSRFGASVDYVLPADAPEFDFASVAGGTLTIDRGNGTRITFGGVATTKIGQVKYDGENVAKRTIEFTAESRTEA